MSIIIRSSSTFMNIIFLKYTYYASRRLHHSIYTDGKQGNFLGSAIYDRDVPDLFCNSFNRTQIFCDDHDVCVYYGCRKFAPSSKFTKKMPFFQK